MNPPIIPDQRELFCTDCQCFRPRALIVEARWMRNGQQVRYRCRPCQAALARKLGAGQGPQRGG